jgi:membrane protein required for colicin V production
MICRGIAAAAPNPPKGAHMIEANINYLDAVILAIMAISCLVAFIRGFLREVLSLGGWIGAFVVTAALYQPVAEWLVKGEYVKKEMVAAAIAVISVYVLSLICFSIITRVLMKYAKSGTDVGMLDNFLGLVFGGVRGALIISLGFFLLTAVMDKDNYPDWVEQAHTRPYAEEGARMLAKLAPESLEEMSSLTKERAEQIQKAKDADQADGYNDQMRENMDRMFNGTSALPETIDDTEEKSGVRYY